jgi:predicted metal-binding membrane protein
VLCGGVLLVAGLAWVWTIRGSMAMGGMGLGPPGSFAAGWTLMMAAMMLPSVLPLLYRFGQEVERRRHWPLAAGLLGLTYLTVWLGFGLVLYTIYTALGMPWPNQPVIGAAVIGLAAIYGLTPPKQAAQARCRELCALHEALPFNVFRAGAVAGFRYGLSCLGCNALLMAAMLAVGMTNLAWAVLVSAFAVLYRFVPRPGPRYEVLVSLTLGVAAVAYLAGW